MPVTVSTLVRRSLSYHARTHLAVLLGVVTASAALTGALVVGDSMRDSLRRHALTRLGPVRFALTSPRYFGEDLAHRIQGDGSASRPAKAAAVAAIIQTTASVDHADTHARTHDVQVYGVEDSFWRLFDSSPSSEAEGRTASHGRNAVINQTLADQIGASVNDDVLLRMPKPADVSIETLLGHRDQVTVTLRLTVSRVIPDTGPGQFGLRPTQMTPPIAYVPLDTLQQTLAEPDRANTLVATADVGAGLRQHLSLEDVGISLRAVRRPDTGEGVAYVSIESDSMLLPPAVENAATAAAESLGAGVMRISAYLANEITIIPPGAAPSTTAPVVTRSIPYSVVAAVDAWPSADAAASSPAESPLPPRTGTIVLNDWAASDLKAHVGDQVRLTYYTTGTQGRLETQDAEFKLEAIIPLAGAAADPGLIPAYRGITDTKRISDWNPPFPVDLKKIQPRDDAYWEQHRATPKAFLNLADGVRLWADHADRFGRLTAFRFLPPPAADVHTLADRVEAALLRELDPARLGLAFQPVREQALVAAQGSTDFAGLFIGFSLFLIASACLLVAMLFRLGVERRASQIGILLATGYTPRLVSRLLLAEGALIALAGGVLGAVAGVGYAWFMLAGLRTWWSAAVNAPFLELFIDPMQLVIGALSAALVAAISIAFAVRGLSRRSPQALLAGALTAQHLPSKGQASRHRRTRSWFTASVAILGLLAAVAMIVAGIATRSTSPEIFFGGGIACLVGLLAAAVRWLRTRPSSLIRRPGLRALLSMAIRNASRSVGRSVTTAGLIAGATFLIVALQAFRLDPVDAVGDRHAANGGFTLYAESAAPLPYDLNDSDRRSALNLDVATQDLLSNADVYPFRLRPGDETSCLNLYEKANPRILGATERFLRRGGFTFAAVLESAPAEGDASADPWLLLRTAFGDGAIPVIGDEAAVKWQLHRDLGDDLSIVDERGRKMTLRFVGLLSGSALQGELVIAESQFVELFPSRSGYAFFLIETPPDLSKPIRQALERDLTPFGFDAASVADRLRGYYAVQNTYLSTFQALGGLGLILGTIGLAAVLLRNVWERRGELALMRALGFTPGWLRGLIETESLGLVVVGLAAGVIPAALAVLPRILHDPATIAWSSIGLLLVGVLFVGWLAAWLGTRSAVSDRIIASLRRD